MSLPSTAWQPGQSGNPNGGKLAAALRRSLSDWHRDSNGDPVLEIDAEGKRNKVKRLQKVADALVTNAIKGNIPAIQECFNRLDGRVPNDLNVTTTKQLDGQSYDELAQSIAEALIRLRESTGTSRNATLPEGETGPLLVDAAQQQDTQQS